MDRAKRRPRSVAAVGSWAAGLWGVGLSVLLAAVGTSIANIALPAIADGFDVGFARVQGVVMAYLAGLTLATISAGWLGDRFGRDRVLRLGLMGFAVASGLCALAPTLAALVAARAVQGALAAVLMTLAVALVKDRAAAGAKAG